MKVYYIAVSSWDGSRAYTFDYILPFLTEQGRNDAIKRIEENPSFKKGDITFHIGQEDIQDLQKEAVEGIVTTRSMAGNIVTAHLDHTYKDGQKVNLIIIEED